MMNESKEELKKSKTLTEDELYNMYFMEKLQQSIDDIENGRVMTIEEAKRRMRERYGINLK